MRKRLLRPWTLMIVQKLHWNGQPRPRSKLDHWPEFRSSDSFGIHGTGTPAMLGRSFR